MRNQNEQQNWNVAKNEDELGKSAVACSCGVFQVKQVSFLIGCARYIYFVPEKTS